MQVRVVLLAILTLAAHAAGAATEPYAPMAATAARTVTGEAIVSWLPGEDLADSFNVYGLSEAGPTFLDSLRPSDEPGPLSVRVSASFPAYAVSGVKDGQESGLVRAILPPDCVLITTDPLSVSVGENCIEVRSLLKVGSSP